MMHTMDITVRMRNFIDSEWLYLVGISFNLAFYRHKDKKTELKIPREYKNKFIFILKRIIEIHRQLL